MAKVRSDPLIVDLINALNIGEPGNIYGFSLHAQKDSALRIVIERYVTDPDTEQIAHIFEQFELGRKIDAEG